MYNKGIENVLVLYVNILQGGRRRILWRYDVMDICPARDGCVRAKIGLTGQLDRRQPGNYFKP